VTVISIWKINKYTVGAIWVKTIKTLMKTEEEEGIFLLFTGLWASVDCPARKANALKNCLLLPVL
jgi:hypothetical protein